MGRKECVEVGRGGRGKKKNVLCKGKTKSVCAV